MIEILLKGNDYTKPINPFRMVVDWKATAIGNPSYGGITKGVKPIMKLSPQNPLGYFPVNILTKEIYGD
jgi:hypothetical protein